MIAPWPECDPQRQDAEIEAQFARFQEVLRAMRDIRARQGVAPKTPLRVLGPLRRGGGRAAAPDDGLFLLDGQRRGDRLRAGRDCPGLKRHVPLAGMEVYIDLAGLIDVEAEMRGSGRRSRSSRASSPRRRRSSPRRTSSIAPRRGGAEGAR